MSIRRFQEENEVKIFVGSIHAAGVGITLTASSHVVFLEYDWTPGVMVQAEDRVHRIGQEAPVLIQYLLFENSLDFQIAQINIEKAKLIEKALG